VLRTFLSEDRVIVFSYSQNYIGEYYQALQLKTNEKEK
jgi:hypothetical protein